MIGIVISFLIVSVVNNASAQMAEGTLTQVTTSGKASFASVYEDKVK